LGGKKTYGNKGTKNDNKGRRHYFLTVGWQKGFGGNQKSARKSTREKGSQSNLELGKPKGSEKKFTISNRHETESRCRIGVQKRRLKEASKLKKNVLFIGLTGC